MCYLHLLCVKDNLITHNIRFMVFYLNFLCLNDNQCVTHTIRLLVSYLNFLCVKIAWSPTTNFVGVSTMAFWVSRGLPTSWARLSVATPSNPYSNTCSSTYSPSCPPLPLNSLVVLWPSSSCKVMEATNSASSMSTTLLHSKTQFRSSISSRPSLGCIPSSFTLDSFDPMSNFKLGGVCSRF